MRALVAALLLWTTLALGTEAIPPAEPPGFSALVKDLDRQAAEHLDKCTVTLEDRKGDFYVVSAQCEKTKYKCFFAVDGSMLTLEGMPGTELLGCVPKPQAF